MAARRRTEGLGEHCGALNIAVARAVARGDDSAASWYRDRMIAPSTARAGRLSVAVVLCLLAANALSAQCSTAWAVDNGAPGAMPAGVAATTVWDPDGAGPLGERLVFAGSFTIAGKVAANGIAAWDPVTHVWSTFGSGVVGAISALAVLPNGNLVIGGTISSAGGVPVNNIARWTGASWTPLGTGVDATVSALMVLGNGDLVAGGLFQSAGGGPASGIARWNGSSWSTYGAGLSGPPPGLFQPSNGVFALTTAANGDIVAAGRFTMAGASPAANIARWDGTTWSALGAGTSDAVFSLRRLANGDIVAGGQFTSAGATAANRIARWDGASWSAYGAGLTGSIFFGTPSVNALATLSNGDLVAAGRFQTAGAVSVSSVARWNGAAWSTMGAGLDNTVSSLTVLSNGALVAGGEFANSGTRIALRLAQWNGTTWSPLESGIGSRVRALATLSTGAVVAGGDGPIVQRDAVGWSVLGTPPATPSFDLTTVGSVLALAVLPNGHLVAGGVFTSAGGVPAIRLARWNGSAWSPIGGGVDGPFVPQVNALAVLPNGDLIVAGRFATVGGNPAQNIARWNGASWSALGAGVDDEVHAVKVLSNGDLIVGGYFATAGGVTTNSIARWNGSTWSSLGTGLSFGGGLGTANAIGVLPNGDVVVAGGFTHAGGVAANNVARWNGTSWSNLGTGLDSYANGMVVLPDGDVVVGGVFGSAGGVGASRMARWNGSAWAPIGAGTNGDVLVLGVDGGGNLVAGGEFTTAGGLVSPFVARLPTNCPASAGSSGFGCPSSGGSNTLTAATLPWVDATFRADGTGLPQVAFVLTLTSVTPIPQGALPLTSVFSQAGPNCDLLVAPDILGLLITTTGTAQSSFFLPNTPPIVGVTFYHQFLLIEVDAQGDWTSVTTTNALALTAGMY